MSKTTNGPSTHSHSREIPPSSPSSDSESQSSTSVNFTLNARNLTPLMMTRVAYLASQPTHPFPAPILEIFGYSLYSDIQIPSTSIEFHKITNSVFVVGYTVRPLPTTWSALDPVAVTLVTQAIKAGMLELDNDEIRITRLLAKSNSLLCEDPYMTITEFQYSQDSISK